MMQKTIKNQKTIMCKSVFFFNGKKGTYDPVTGQLLNNTDDIRCTDNRNYCSTATWANRNWLLGNIPDLNPDPPAKDTIVVPTG